MKADHDYRVWDNLLNEDNDDATWFIENKQVPVPEDEWFLMEVYWYWNEGTGYVAWRVNGQVIAEKEAPSTRNGKPIDFIMLTQTYGAKENLYQWVDDIEIWDEMPARYEENTELSVGDKLTSYVAQDKAVHYIVSAKEGETIAVVLDELTADADLYLKIGSEASGSSYDCAVWEEGAASETCSVTLDQDADVSITVYGAQATSYQLQITKEETSAIQLTLDKDSYLPTDNIEVSYTGMLGGADDWLGVYKKSDNNDWENVRAWSWSDGQANGAISLAYENLPQGDYEVRAFFNNSFDLEKAVSFTVESGVQLTLDNQVYPTSGTLHVSYTGMLGGSADWLGIYKKGDNNDWGNVKAWSWSDGQVNGAVSLDYVNLPAGQYELRVFFNNSFKHEQVASFVVNDSL